MNFRPRFRLRTLLVAVALVAAALALFPRLWWRHKVNVAIEATLEQGPDVHWAFNPLQSGQLESFAYLLSDRQRVLEQLIAAVETETKAVRRANAVRAIQALTAQSGSPEERDGCLAELIRIATSAEVLPGTKREVCATIAHLIPATGINQAQRRAILAATRAAPPEQRIAWIEVLNAIGGREETLLLIRYGDTHDPGQLWAVFNGHLRRLTWPRMLAHVQRWLSDPIIAEYALECFVLSYTPAGRSTLLDYALDPARPVELREKAIQRLQETLPGLELLLRACLDSAVSRKLSELLETDAPATFDSILAAELRQRNGDALWTELIDSLDPSWISSPSGLPVSPEGRAALQKEREEHAAFVAESSLDCLRKLSNQSDLTTKDEWAAWHARSKPGMVPQERLLRLVLDDPKLLGHAAILRRLWPYWMGHVPEECLPLYRLMLQSDQPEVQFWACFPLVMYEGDPEAVEVAIDLVGKSSRGEAASRHPGAILMLRDRFAENFFWDTAAWKRWWAEQQQ
jgi:hypothetical protein